jgi:hypothetical protein
MRLFFGLLATVTLAGLGLTGCADPSLVEQTYGDAYRTNKHQMTANPEAGSQPLHEGMDPLTTEQVLDAYVRGQKAQEQRRPGKSRGPGIVIGEFE